MLTILEPAHGGHHATYLRWIIEGALRRGVRVRLGTVDSAFRDDPRMASLGRELGGEIELATLPDPIPAHERASDISTLGLYRREFRYRRLLAALANELETSGPLGTILVPYLDYALHAFGLAGAPFGPTPWSGIVMRPSFHYGSEGIIAPRPRFARAKEKLFYRALGSPTLRRLFTIDPTLEDHAARVAPDLARERLCFLPEATDVATGVDRSEARRALELPADLPLLLVYGELRGRKGLDALLAASLDEHFPSRLGLLLAGRQFPETRKLLASPAAHELQERGRLFALDQVIERELEARLFASADIVWLGYRGHYNSSAVLIQAGQCGLPLVACREGLIGRQACEHGLGPVVAIDDASEVAAALAGLIDDPHVARECGARGHVLFGPRQPDSFSEEILSGIGILETAAVGSPV